MKLIESKAEYIHQEKGLEGVYKQIELCGRTCYKSEDKITEDSAKGFVERMIKSNHTAMLEQGTVYLKIPYNLLQRITRIGLCNKYIDRYIENPYSRTHEMYEFLDTTVPHDTASAPATMVPYLAVTTNLRVLVENDWLEDLKYICEPTKYHERRYTMRFVTDRGVSHELVRHRLFSFAQESTRYCNYSKDKFGNEVTFIKPSWLNCIYKDIPLKSELCYLAKQHPDEAAHRFIASLVESKYAYMTLLQKGLTPQQARQVLPNALKTEVCMTGFASDWRYFFDLRLFGKTGAPHPDMKLLAEKAKVEAEKCGIWKDIMKYPSKFE